jgi:two-component system, OmpR family, response regulator CiaR
METMGNDSKGGILMRVLIVEDDVPLSHAIRAVFEDEKYEVDTAETGNEGFMLAETGIYDLLVLDIMLPNRNGLSIIRELRGRGVTTPTLFLTAKDSVQARVEGLDAGGDDYLVKPFAVEELLARSRSLLRRAGKLGAEGQLTYGPLVLHAQENDASVDGQRLKLTSKEYELLEYLVRNREQILRREQIFDRVWGFDSEANAGMVDLYIHYLRKKLSTQGADGLIRTVRGVGYRLKEETEHVQKD